MHNCNELCQSVIVRHFNISSRLVMNYFFTLLWLFSVSLNITVHFPLVHLKSITGKSAHFILPTSNFMPVVYSWLISPFRTQYFYLCLLYRNKTWTCVLLQWKTVIGPRIKKALCNFLIRKKFKETWKWLLSAEASKSDDYAVIVDKWNFWLNMLCIL